MSVGGISNNAPYSAQEAAQIPKEAESNQKGDEEVTVVTTQCDKEHKHDKSCPHTVTTQPAPRVGQNGHLMDKRA